MLWVLSKPLSQKSAKKPIVERVLRNKLISSMNKSEHRRILKQSGKQLIFAIIGCYVYVSTSFKRVY